MRKVAVECDDADAGQLLEPVTDLHAVPLSRALM